MGIKIGKVVISEGTLRRRGSGKSLCIDLGRIYKDVCIFTHM